VVIAGYGVYSGRGKQSTAFRCSPSPNRGLVLVGVGAILIVWGLVSFL
jgi:hypothetical protein